MLTGIGTIVTKRPEKVGKETAELVGGHGEGNADGFGAARVDGFGFFDEEFLHAEWSVVAGIVAPSFGAEGAQVLAVGVQDPAFGGVFQIEIEDFDHALAKSDIANREHHFDTFVEVAWHPVGGAEIEIGLAAIFEIEDAAVLEEAADETSYADTMAEASDAGPESAGAANNEIDLDAGARGAIESLDDRLIEQGVHLGDDARGTVAAGMGRFAIN